MKANGTNQDIENGETLEGIEEIIKSVSMKKRGRSKDDLQDDDCVNDGASNVQSKSEKEVKELM